MILHHFFTCIFNNNKIPEYYYVYYVWPQDWLVFNWMDLDIPRSSHNIDWHFEAQVVGCVGHLIN